MMSCKFMSIENLGAQPCE